LHFALSPSLLQPPWDQGKIGVIIFNLLYDSTFYKQHCIIFGTRWEQKIKHIALKKRKEEKNMTFVSHSFNNIKFEAYGKTDLVNPSH
jgi:hypothetical protein